MESRTSRDERLTTSSRRHAFLCSPRHTTPQPPPHSEYVRSCATLSSPLLLRPSLPRRLSVSISIVYMSFSAFTFFAPTPPHPAPPPPHGMVAHTPPDPLFHCNHSALWMCIKANQALRNQSIHSLACLPRAILWRRRNRTAACLVEEVVAVEPRCDRRGREKRIQRPVSAAIAATKHNLAVACWHARRFWRLGRCRKTRCRRRNGCHRHHWRRRHCDAGRFGVPAGERSHRSIGEPRASVDWQFRHLGLRLSKYKRSTGSRKRFHCIVAWRRRAARLLLVDNLHRRVDNSGGILGATAKRSRRRFNEHLDCF